MAALLEDNLFAVIIKGSLGLLAVSTLVGCAFFSLKTGMGVLVGGTIAIVNFFWLRSVIQRIIGLLPSKPVLYAQSRFLIRIILTGLALYAAITSGWFSVAGLLVGLAVIVVNIIALSIYAVFRAGG